MAEAKPSVKDPDWERDKDEKPSKKITKEEPDSEKYPKTLVHSDSTPGRLITKTVANSEEEAGLDAGWGSVADLDFETAPAQASTPEAIQEIRQAEVTGLAASEIPGGTQVFAIDDLPNRVVIANVVRGKLNQPSPAAWPPPEEEPEIEPPLKKRKADA